MSREIAMSPVTAEQGSVTAVEHKVSTDQAQDAGCTHNNLMRTDGLKRRIHCPACLWIREVVMAQEFARGC